jgi:iron complex outermembrane receptor protein
MCGYVDLEADLNDRFLVNLATRYEHYSDFGGNLAGKIAIRYKLFNKLSLRDPWATVSVHRLFNNVIIVLSPME